METPRSSLVIRISTPTVSPGRTTKLRVASMLEPFTSVKKRSTLGVAEAVDARPMHDASTSRATPRLQARSDTADLECVMGSPSLEPPGTPRGSLGGFRGRWRGPAMPDVAPRPAAAEQREAEHADAEERSGAGLRDKVHGGGVELERRYLVEADGYASR